MRHPKSRSVAEFNSTYRRPRHVTNTTMHFNEKYTTFIGLLPLMLSRDDSCRAY